jgi:hypothetical protein
MSRAKALLLLLGGLAIAAAVLFWAYRTAPPPAPAGPIAPLPGLSWLPADATLVGSVDLAELRRQAWLVEALQHAGGPVQEEPDYRTFVEATGFDYTRDLDRVWIAASGATDAPVLAGVAEGRFSRARVLDYVRPRAAVQRHDDFDIYELRPQKTDAARPPRPFALAFLDDAHLAFGSSSAQVAGVIDCWLGKAPDVDSDPARREFLLELAAGRQAWVADRGGFWQSWFPGKPQEESLGASAITQVDFAFTVTDQGIQLAAQAQCRQPDQARRLRDNLGIMAVLGQLALGREEEETAQLLSESLKNVNLTQRESHLYARTLLPRRVVERLLQPPPATAEKQR